MFDGEKKRKRSRVCPKKDRKRKKKLINLEKPK
jgi:hypothetical protein